MTNLRQCVEEPAQQFIQVARLELDAEKLVESLRLGFPDLVVSIVQSENHAEVKLLSHPLEIRIFVGQQFAEQRSKQPVVFLKRFNNTAGRNIQLSQPSSVVFHLLDEFQRRLAAAENPRGCARC